MCNDLFFFGRSPQFEDKRKASPFGAQDALTNMSDEELDDVLETFVREVRKVGQEDYSAKSFYEMILCMQEAISGYRVREILLLPMKSSVVFEISILLYIIKSVKQSQLSNRVRLFVGTWLFGEN